MATTKSFTDVSQSKKLAEILPLESADMCLTFVNNVWNPVWGKADNIYQLQKDCYEPDYTKNEYIDIDEFEPKVVPCWSLGALLGVLPIIEDYYAEIRCVNNRFCCCYTHKHIGDLYWNYASNPVDACYEMILKLNELKMLWL